MIRVNLLPGGKKRASAGRGFSFQLPSFGGGGGGGGLGALQDRWILGGVLVPLLCVGTAAWMYLSVSAEEEELSVAVAEAVQDSARFADLIERTDLLQARSDSIAEKVAIIQEIDEGRYVWPHLLDEVARALPQYTWLNDLIQVVEGPEPEIQVSGQTGNNLALAAFMEQLESSPFIRNVELIQSEQTLDQATGQTVYSFQLEMAYEQPPLEFLETVPLFEGGPAPIPGVEDEGGEPVQEVPDTAAAADTAAVPDTAGSDTQARVAVGPRAPL